MMKRRRRGMTPRKQARINGDPTYIAFCKICDKETEHELNWMCKPCRALWRKNNKELIKEGMKRYYQDYREERLLYQKQYIENNPDKIKITRFNDKDRSNERRRKRYREDPVFRMRHIMSISVWKFYKKRGGSKEGNTTEELLGYTAEELQENIDSKLKKGMTRDNYGKVKGGWEIDHRIPQSYFTEIDQLKECFALENLKPEWREWNQSKGNRFIG